jgi:AcrR family transcriptional regulator
MAKTWSRDGTSCTLAAGVFRRHGFRGTTMKALARACGLSIPGLYRYFPSKRAFALFPLHAVNPELQASPPDLSVGDPCRLLFGWVEHAVEDTPNIFLALQLAVETGLSDEERRAVEPNLQTHADELGALVRHAAPNLDQRSATELAWAMMNLTMAPGLSGMQPEPSNLRGQLHALLHGYGIGL